MNQTTPNGQSSANGFGALPPSGEYGETETSARNQSGSMSDGGKKSGSGFGSELSALIADVEELITSNTSLSADEISRIKDKITARVDAAKAAIESGTRTVREQARQAVTATDSYVTQEPWKAVGIGAGLGFLAGVLVARR